MHGDTFKATVVLATLILLVPLGAAVERHAAVRQFERVHAAQLAVPTENQAQPQSWLIWKEPGTYALPARLYKVQDGSCSIYVVVKTSDAVAVATGQGCR